MRYMISFEPQGFVNNKLQIEPNLRMFNSGFHTTICNVNLKKEDEEKINEAFSLIESQPFQTKIIGYDLYGRNSCVLVLKKTKIIQELHELALQTLRQFDKNPDLFDQMQREIGFEKFNPHITYFKGEKFPELRVSYIGAPIIVNSINLMRKEKGLWKKVMEKKL